MADCEFGRQDSFTRTVDGEAALQEAGGDTSKLLERPFVDHGTPFANAAPDLKFAAAVAEFGMILRDSQYKGNGSLGAVAEWAQEGKGADRKRLSRRLPGTGAKGGAT